MSESQARKSKSGDTAKRQQQDETAESGSVMDQASELASNIAGGAKDLASRGAEVVRDQYNRASRGTRAAYDRGVQLEDRLEQAIKRNPVTAVLVTAGIGLLIGFVLGRESVPTPPRHWWQRFNG
jgi:ElaB/YqjD/DUF883 family membrane-anchored ribosome-binding protein